MGSRRETGEREGARERTPPGGGVRARGHGYLAAAQVELREDVRRGGVAAVIVHDDQRGPLSEERAGPLESVLVAGNAPLRLRWPCEGRQQVTIALSKA